MYFSVSVVPPPSIKEDSRPRCSARRLGTEMLVLSRKVGERIWIGDKICVTVVRIAQNGVRIGIEAPQEYAVVREELDREAISRPEKSEGSQVVAQSKPR